MSCRTESEWHFPARTVPNGAVLQKALYFSEKGLLFEETRCSGSKNKHKQTKTNVNHRISAEFVIHDNFLVERHGVKAWD